MSERSRFCVLFSGTNSSNAKTRLLHNDSSIDDIKQIWKTIYDEDPPPKAEIIINENCIYRLDDLDDLQAFFAQAEDQYKILPSDPLKVILGFSESYFASKNAAKDKQKNSEFATDLSTKKKSQDALNENNNNSYSKSNLSPENSPIPKPFIVKSEPSNIENEIYKPASQLEKFSNWTSQSNFFSSLCDKLKTTTGFSTSDSSNYLPKPKYSLSPNRPISNTVESAINRISAENSHPLNLKNLTPASDAYNGIDNHKVLQPSNHLPLMGYAKHMYDQKMESNIPHSPNAHNNVSQTNMPLKAPFDMPAYSAFMDRLQKNRMMQNSQNASFLLQTFLSNQVKSLAAARDSVASTQAGAMPSLPGFPVQSSPLDIKNPLLQFPNPMMFPPKNHNLPSTSQSMQQLQDTSNRNVSVFNSLADNNNSFLNYMNGANNNNLKDSTKKPPKKRNRAKTAQGMMIDGKPNDTAKRMRSSTSQSNIEYHYERALDYSVMNPEEQKLQNSAHRSHWKHLLFVIKTSPSFLKTFKHAKYDEWSSEARDIFAISQPDRYMWSFLTLSKQGDLLCKRIIGRIDGLINMKTEERPDWCPTDEVLQKAQAKARDRLSQLQRILFSRAINNENNKNPGNTKASKHVNNKLASFQDQSLAFMTAYHQRQKEYMQNHKDALTHVQYNTFNAAEQPSEKNLPGGMPQNINYCSSVTSSPISNISPIADQRMPQDGSRGEQTDSPPSTPGEPQGRTSSDNDGCLVIDTARKSSGEKSPHSTRLSSDLDSKDSGLASPPSVTPTNILSPHRWSLATKV